ncbi:fungal-specific transcription factor domain-domain-containing protein [Naematelia encephala]|uniref:Fungal-specific transcription factor domain-domain-containing protein n=1 Tax=Naematelia encephala TaxID=71784 RepID=A0A1Y2AW55_9TREE|nr:fungal-specific transcription factor domain-domain-containing protein [Naematelia encephala]
MSDLEDCPRPSKRTRSSVACNRCKERRQKCDNASPSCSKCSKAGVQCVYRGGDHPAWYVESLEDRIQLLEESLRVSGLAVRDVQSWGTPGIHETAVVEPASIHGSSQAQAVPGKQSVESEVNHIRPSSSGRRPERQLPPVAPIETGTSFHTNKDVFPPTHLGDAVGFLSLCAAAEPYYVGASTGFSLANLVQAAVYARVSTAQEEDAHAPDAVSASATPEDPSRSIRNLPSMDDRPFSCHRPRETTQAASLPPDGLGNELLAAYLAKVHSSIPFLNRNALEALHTRRHELPASTSRSAQLGLSKLHLVYGIGARHLQLSGRSQYIFDKTLPEAHFIAATEHLDVTFETRTTESVELMLLLTLYSLHSPSGPGAWQLTGMAVRLSVELGLHKAQRSPSASYQLADQMRKRLFWSTIIIERKVALTLGRPFALADHDIDVDVPVDIDDTVKDPAAIAAAAVDSTPTPTSLTRFVHTARLQRILGRIQMHNARSVGSQSDEVARIKADLQNWRNTMQMSSRKDVDTDPALLLEYYKGMHLLLQPLVTSSTRQLEHLRECAEAAGSICQLYKRLHQRTPAGFFLLELHDVLLAGISLIYCLWVDPTGPSGSQILVDLGACSTVMFLIAERWESAKRYRDAFEVLVGATTDYKQRHCNMPTAPIVGAANEHTPVDMSGEGLALFDANLWGDDEASMWRRMLGEITGTTEPNVDDSWLWFNELGT